MAKGKQITFDGLKYTCSPKRVKGKETDALVCEVSKKEISEMKLGECRETERGVMYCRTKEGVRFCKKGDSKRTCKSRHSK